MAATAAKDEGGIRASLDVSAQRGLNIFAIRIGVDLLEFVNGDNARSVGIVEITKNFIKGDIGVFDA